MKACVDEGLKTYKQVIYSEQIFWVKKMDKACKERLVSSFYQKIKSFGKIYLQRKDLKVFIMKAFLKDSSSF